MTLEQTERVRLEGGEFGRKTEQQVQKLRDRKLFGESQEQQRGQCKQRASGGRCIRERGFLWAIINCLDFILV